MHEYICYEGFKKFSLSSDKAPSKKDFALEEKKKPKTTMLRLRTLTERRHVSAFERTDVESLIATSIKYNRINVPVDYLGGQQGFEL